jgi:hypothetical protein
MSVTSELRRRVSAEQSIPRYEPCLPRPAKQPPVGPGWIHEIKHDGFRIIAHRNGDRVQLVTRAGNNFSSRFPLIAAAIAALPVRSCVIDGEAIACDENGLSVFELLRAPDAPYDLTDEQSKEWWAVINRCPPSWFPRETHGMLAQYCRHIVRARRVAELINAMEKDRSSKFNLAEYKDLLRIEEEQTRAISSLATRMRISHFDDSRMVTVWRRAGSSATLLAARLNRIAA